MIVGLICFNRSNKKLIEVFRVISTISGKFLFNVNLQERMRLFLLLQRSPKNRKLSTLFK